ncbi:putative DHBP synthase RibB-like [Vibrio nigripulchritudo SFn27]|uniref:Putative DHBP synthase RibB-like n=1 Tax=Vibrio nigripulchritudo TaxID=28173 RepID=U4K4Z6_9VIBR|nr:Sua5/YciO/YrdC/YwlC family protein [Vibrio nigripulchritudo]CCN85270.1 putative DHBP synthase RibB-like [Vibrio nigripulchritudo BLFn1]CCN87580.1 putative DHBP synthase RibB-like [Vibrio nigripulchritudo SFn27]CCN92461.1 putative DHBP synthase RibB-like [Vibrio nigripulchritudo ENn2]CCO39325.1 putative DHBP synthase RibB-like [Vibrio nigripulchritudo SFn135]CCO53447.1 putative DHBP synthase RibB-like [Vibrio nigripulchritudo Wn13]
MTERVKWDGSLVESAAKFLEEGKMIVSPTKVGYIIMAANEEGLKRKFDAKQRKLNKPAVVLCGSMEQLKELAELNKEVEAFYQLHWDQDVLMGCIVPWKKEALEKLDPEVRKLVTDHRNTSCFVVKFGTPSEQIVAHNWDKGILTFASSANPSGKGNRGQVEYIGDRIEAAADLIIEANDYVASIQPDKTVETRYEQGVMVAMVDSDGILIPEQGSERSISPAPILIRKGLDIEQILINLSDSFQSWDYRHGEYY